jgi:hypothetical protein
MRRQIELHVLNAKRLFVAGVMAGLLGSPATAGADVVLDWNAIALTTTSTQNPFNQARLLAITQLAAFEAVNAVTGLYAPYLGTVTAYGGESADAAAVAAAHRVLRHYVPAAAAALDQALMNSLAAIADGYDKDSGIALGTAAADAMIAARLNDGAAPPQFGLPDSTDPGVWQLTATCPAAGGVLANWRNVRPFGIERATDFLPDPPPALTSTRYAKDYNEVMSVGRLDSTTRPQDRADVARFYGLAATPGHVVNLAARQMAAAQVHSLSQNARAFALINMAISDGSVATFEAKYHYTFWRPETAIPAGATDDNFETDADADWKPFLPTPCFPGYVSNHAAASYAGAEILRRLYGAGGHSIAMSNPASSIPGFIRYYTKLRDITADVDDARVYGGIHFRFDQEEGAQMGRQVAASVWHRNLRTLTGEGWKD